MEEKQPISTEDHQLIERLMMEQARAYTPPAEESPENIAGAPARPRPRQRSRRRSPARQITLLITGLLCYALLIVLLASAWGSLTYMRQGEVAEATAIPSAIFLIAIFFSSCLVTTLSRGGTIFPALALAVTANIVSLIFAQAPETKLSGILLKLSLALIVAVAGFVISKLLYMNGQASRDNRNRAA